MQSPTQENYLKCIYKLLESDPTGATTNAIAARLSTKAATVTDMLKKLSEQKYIQYQKYKPVILTRKGRRHALKIIRAHRLWEVFLVEKLHYKWHEIHELAEIMEHVQDHEFITRLDNFLGSPKFDPHGDPIPDEDGEMTQRKTCRLSDFKPQVSAVVAGVTDHTHDFLVHLDILNITVGSEIRVKSISRFDETYQVIVNRREPIFIGQKVAHNLLVIRKNEDPNQSSIIK